MQCELSEIHLMIKIDALINSYLRLLQVRFYVCPFAMLFQSALYCQMVLFLLSGVLIHCLCNCCRRLRVGTFTQWSVILDRLSAILIVSVYKPKTSQ